MLRWTRHSLRPRAIGGAKWEPLQKEGLEPTAAAVVSRQLTEMVTYLLAIYFITELALAANPSDFEAIYGTTIPEPSLPGAPFRSEFILSLVANTYQYVDIDQNNQKDKKKLKPGLVAGDPEPLDGQIPLLGTTGGVRFAAVALVVPFHALLWACARWQVTGQMLPVLTYIGIRDSTLGEDSQLGLPLVPLLVFHFVLSGIGLGYLLFVPSGSCIRSCGSNSDKMWEMSPVPFLSRLVRYIFWITLFAIKFLLATIIFRAMFEATVELQIALPGRESVSELSKIYYSTEWGSDFLLWFAPWKVLWSTTFVLFISDTQLWFTLLCSILGVATVMVQRGGRCFTWAVEDSVAKLPERFSRKVAQFSPYFPAIWDRILEYMRYEDKIDNHLMGDLSFKSGESGHQVYWQQLRQPLAKRRRDPASPSGRDEDGTELMVGGSYATTTLPKTAQSSVGTPKPRRKIKVPDIFREKTAFEVQWRLLALSRGLGLPMPRPFRAPLAAKYEEEFGFNADVPWNALHVDDKGITAELDLVHPKQKRRYYSSLIDGACEDLPLFMMQQGGVSKATKTVNLSEDIFAGQGRDLGFNTVLGFFSKLSSGTGALAAATALENLFDSGRHWVEWYDRTQLKPRSGGLHASMVDITFVVAVFFLAAWYAMINMKIDALMLAYSGALSSNMLHIAALLPPIFLSLGYCIGVVLFENMVGCSSILRRRMRPRPAAGIKGMTRRMGSMARKVFGKHAGLSDASKLRSDPPVVPPQETAETPSEAAADAEAGGRECTTATDEDEERADREVAPAVAPALPAGPEATQRWCILAAAVSSIIFSVMVPFARIPDGPKECDDAIILQKSTNKIEDYFCPGCSAHQLLIYRDPGHLARAEAVRRSEQTAP
eukprot:Skav215187  [mRNA]  locus=scaffold3330:62429:82690:- [translate_table: standard]